MPVFEFVMRARPVSVNIGGQRMRDWRRAVRKAAALEWAGAPLGSQVVVSVGNFYGGGQVPDADNVIKPVQDAMIGVAYIDDRQVIDSLGFKRSMLGLVPLARLPRLRLALLAGGEFVHVAVAEERDRHFEGVLT